ncbi:hypothetical protein O181_027096 [Austropuccinia psidii MF-1]|uniref:Reverse transcriptase Ty1/copia-type domain-containing protein n=1 Tax=Austropuccinia psidii MF-1 TaxID=1389203 RepID=A0A9Q3CLN8_9BASI|nr:hypothetical protein [Austropuccinia psidii MF-1]
MNVEFQELANERGFFHVTSPSNTPQLYGFSEQANRTILEKACCLLLGANPPNQYCAEAVSHATFLTNLIMDPSRNNLLQFHLWTGSAPKIKHIGMFGCKVVFAIPHEKRPWKLAPTGDIGILLGLDYDIPEYRILKLQDNKVFITRHVIFFENDFLSPSNLPKPKSDELFFSDEIYHLDSKEEVIDCQEHLEITHNPIEEIASPTDDSESTKSFSESTIIQPGKRISVIEPHHPTLIYSRIEKENILPYSRNPKALMTLSGSGDPSSYKQALWSSNTDQWFLAINKELQTMKELNIWELVPITSETKMIGTTWVFKTKLNAQNEILEHKAHLWAQGFSQTLGIDFLKTFAPTGRLNFLRTLISFAVSKNCLGLKKVIYGLCPAPRAWYNRLSSWLETVGFKAAISDPCVFHRNSHPPMWLFINVDHIGVFGKDLTKFKQEIEEFNTKLLGKADLMLGIKIYQNNEHIGLSQEHYVNSILELYGMSDCCPVATPLIPNEHLETRSQEETMEFENLNTNYRSAIGSLSYISTAIRPDVSYAVSCLLQFLEKPRIQKWNTFIHVLRYLKCTANVCIIYKKNIEEKAITYSDADWGNCRVTRRSVSGHLILFNKGLVIWKTKK